MNDKWMKDLKDLSGGYEKKAPEGLLDDIKREMSRRGVMSAAEPKKARVVTVKMWQRAAAVLALLLASGIAVNQLSDEETGKEKPAIQDEEPLLASTEPVWDLAGKDAISDVSLAKVKDEMRMTDFGEEAIVDETVEAEVVNEKKDAVEEQSQKTEGLTQPKDTLDNSAVVHEREYLAMNNLPDRPMKQEHRSWGIGAYYGGGASVGQGEDLGLYDNAPYSDSVCGGPDNPGSVEPEQGYGGEKLTEEHHQPVKIGISVRYRLNERWSLQSGLTYSYLESQLTAQKGSQTIVTDQELHYLGIPLGVNYSIWHNRHVNVYVGAGGEIEKLVNGKRLHGADKMTRPWTETVKESSPIFSANASAGLEWLLGDYFSLYAEPGASYHFDNGSSVHSAYTDDPFHFNLNIGIRLNLSK